MLSISESTNPRFEGTSVFYNDDYCWYFRGIISRIPGLPENSLNSAQVVKVLRYVQFLSIFHTILDILTLPQSQLQWSILLGLLYVCMNEQR